MAETIYFCNSIPTKQNLADICWLTRNDLQIYNQHLSMYNQDSLSEITWNKIYDEGAEYAMLFIDAYPVARACVEKYSEDIWEVSDVRVATQYRNKGFAIEKDSTVLLTIFFYCRNSP